MMADPHSLTVAGAAQAWHRWMRWAPVSRLTAEEDSSGGTWRGALSLSEQRGRMVPQPGPYGDTALRTRRDKIHSKYGLTP